MNRIAGGFGWLLRTYIGWVLFSVAGSALEQFTRLDPGAIAPVSAVLTLLTGVAVLAVPMVRALGARRAVAALILVTGFGACVELIGTKTGVPFGSYYYTDRWQPVIYNPFTGPFPLLVPFAWMLIAGGSYLLWSSLKSRWIALVLSAATAATLDASMEGVMTLGLRFWVWKGHTGMLAAPLSNFVGWFFVSFLAAGMLELLDVRRVRACRDAAIVLSGHMFLIGCLALLHSLVPFALVWALVLGYLAFRKNGQADSPRGQSVE